MTRSAVVERPAALVGAQRPRLLWTPEPASLETAEECLEFLTGIGKTVGVGWDPWQRDTLTYDLAEDDRGRWQSFETAQIAPRQNGKDGWIEGRELVGLYVLPEKLLIHTTHEFKTTVEHFRRVLWWLDNVDALRRRVRRINRAHGEEGVELLDGSRLLFHARTASSGRGFSCDCLVYNEAQRLKADAVRASMPALSARPNPHVIYAATAGDESSDMLAEVRRRGMAGGDPALTFMEFSADEDAYRVAQQSGPDAVEAFERDPVNILVANPGIGAPRASALTLEHALREQRAMRGDPGAYAAERLGIGTWPTSSGAGGPITLEQWAEIQDPASTALDPVVLSLAVSVDGSRSAVGVSGRREDGLRHVEVLDHRPGVHWLPERMVQLRDDHKPSCVVVNAAGRASSVVPALVEAGFVVHSGKGDPEPGSLVLLTGPDVTAAFGAFVSGVVEEPTVIRYRTDARWPTDTAVAQATTRWVGQAQAWDGKNLADISTLEAVTLAAHGHAKYGGSEYDVLESVF